jgi:uncharacterized protein YecE (DUF72 family)
MAKRKPAPGQLDLFEAPARDALRARFGQLSEVAARLPSRVKFGTSSWSFPGWTGIVYPPGMTESQIARDGLPLYVQHPLLRTVGIDRSYYAPIAAEELRRYAQQLPPGFPCCAKVPSMFTSPVLSRGGGTEPNPDFLHAERFAEIVVRPFLKEFSDHLGPMILEFPPVRAQHRLTCQEFEERLDAFLSASVGHLKMAVEIRDRALLTPGYARVLARHGASHTYNYWTAMPMLREQAGVVPLDTAEHVVVRLMLRPGTRYEERRQAFLPFDRIVDESLQMREQVAEMVRLAEALGRNIVVLVNNKAEGSAPLTIEALARLCVREGGS